MEKTYVKESTIPNCGKGLFANKFIKEGQIIEYYTGILKKKNIIGTRSNIYFDDGTIMQCFDNDKASFANDAIKFDNKRRKLMETLKSEIPFYDTYPNICINAEINIINKRKKAYLKATKDIKPDEEIFCHYGFKYWLIQELQYGFLQEEEIEKNGFPDNIFHFPAFKKYVEKFYPDCIQCKVNQDENQDFMIVLECKFNKTLRIPIPNLKKSMQKIPIN